MMIFKILTILLTIIIISIGVYHLIFKKNRNKNNTILGYSYLIAGAFGLLLSIFIL